MKKLSFLPIAIFLFVTSGSGQLLKKLSDKLKAKTEQAAVHKPDTTVTAINKQAPTPVTESPVKDDSAPASLKVYSNYDFVPGDQVIFEDNFSEDQDGEFPSHWELINGQGILNKQNNEEAFYLTDGNYVRVAPLIKKKKYLGSQFTIEFDTYCEEGAYGLRMHLVDSMQNDLVKVQTNSGELNCSFPEDKSLTGTLPENLRSANYFNKWHHYAIAFKNGQLKIYCDASRVLVVPNCNATPAGIEFAGIGSQENPLIFKNIRVADGAGMNMLGKKFTDTKIVTHGINFDVNKAIIKPESMGTLNAVVQVMNDNADIKFEVGGHTDSDGDDALNMKLSQQRADAVRMQLISMGIDASRLTARGYGKTKPIADNKTFEGKANNRRVEFVKL